MIEQSQRTPTAPKSAETALRVRFIPVGRETPPVNGERRFLRPRAVDAVLETLSPSSTFAEGPCCTDGIEVVLLPLEPGKDQLDRSRRWLSESGALIGSIRDENWVVRLSRARAVIQASVEDSQSVLAAVIEIAFYDSELTAMTQQLEPIEAGAPSDVPLSYRIRRGHQQSWNRLTDTMQTLSVMRLAFARLEPQVDWPGDGLSASSRRVFNRLVTRTALSQRLEAFSNRLEACEDLYEGAVDRINDHRWYVRGLVIEVAIVVILIIETLSLFWQHVR